jgi:hypothetical protein
MSFETEPSIDGHIAAISALIAPRPPPQVSGARRFAHSR